MVFRQMDKVKVNADDYGLSPEINEAVYQKKEVDSVSLIVTTGYYQHALTLKTFDDTGLHLSLTDPWYSYRQFLLNYFAGKIKGKDI